MRLGIYVLTLGFVSFCLASCGDVVFGGWHRVQEDFHYSYPLSAGGRIEVENQNGPVDITGWDQNNVDVSGTKYASSPEWLKEMKVEVIPASTSVSIRTVRSHVSWGNMGVRYVIRVPHGVELARVFTSNGPIHVDDIDAETNLRTSNGPVRLTGIKGPIQVETSNGPVNVTDAAGPARLRTSNGPVELSLNSVADVRARTSNGPITLRIPSGTGATVRASTSHGRIRSDFDVKTDDEASRYHLAGTIGPGGPLLDLSTTNGPIRVLRR
jgi:DUF4097 and DUF4098 domain-containing protein YvlB